MPVQQTAQAVALVETSAAQLVLVTRQGHIGLQCHDVFHGRSIDGNVAIPVAADPALGMHQILDEGRASFRGNIAVDAFVDAPDFALHALQMRHVVFGFRANGGPLAACTAFDPKIDAGIAQGGRVLQPTGRLMQFAHRLRIVQIGRMRCQYRRHRHVAKPFCHRLRVVVAMLGKNADAVAHCSTLGRRGRFGLVFRQAVDRQLTVDQLDQIHDRFRLAVLVVVDKGVDGLAPFLERGQRIIQQLQHRLRTGEHLAVDFLFVDGDEMLVDRCHFLVQIAVQPGRRCAGRKVFLHRGARRLGAAGADACAQCIGCIAAGFAGCCRR